MGGGVAAAREGSEWKFGKAYVFGLNMVYFVQSWSDPELDKMAASEGKKRGESGTGDEGNCTCRHLMRGLGAPAGNRNPGGKEALIERPEA